METRGTGRRTLLQRGLALLAGGAAVVGAQRLVRAEAPVDPKPDSTLTLYARKRQLAAPPDAVHGAHMGDSRVLASGELFDAPDGAPIGAFYTTCFCLGTPLGPRNDAASNLGFQVLHLNDGTLFGMCGGTTENGAKLHAVVGGTNRYAGARGSYVERAASGQGVRPEMVEFVITLAG